MLTHDREQLHSSVESDWRTPPALYAALDRIFDFDIDAAASFGSSLERNWLGPGGLRPNALDVPTWYHLPCTDGDDDYWEAETFYANPPYSKQKYHETHDPSYLVSSWAEKCFQESLKGCTIVGLFPYAVQTDWFRRWVYGHLLDPEKVLANVGSADVGWGGHAADAVWKFPHRINFLRPDGSPAANAAVNHCVIVWRPPCGFVGHFVPTERYWTWK